MAAISASRNRAQSAGDSYLGRRIVRSRRREPLVPPPRRDRVAQAADANARVAVKAAAPDEAASLGLAPHCAAQRLFIGEHECATIAVIRSYAGPRGVEARDAAASIEIILLSLEGAAGSPVVMQEYINPNNHMRPTTVGAFILPS